MSPNDADAKISTAKEPGSIQPKYPPKKIQRQLAEMHFGNGQIGFEAHAHRDGVGESRSGPGRHLLQQTDKDESHLTGGRCANKSSENVSF
jgi:hypothetical protein